MIPTDPIKHTQLAATKNVRETAKAAADAAFQAGGSPRAQIDAARAAVGNDKLGYMPHQGMRERQRRLKRMARQ